ncbi:MAG: hypothetical protein HN509_13825 [Halobacteriovoraceae bacterium]|jgi:hypothetical protein|nr:hypothetical protein [Halobacteriovoraceae bacterium]MBT5093300.1 hypothetical protein [Halobacteriovoraceae bacterium]
MKTLSLALCLLFSSQLAAKGYSCNLNLSTAKTTITAKDIDKYIKRFELQLPVLEKKQHSFKGIELEVYPSDEKEIAFRLKDNKSEISTSTSYEIGQDVIALSLNETNLICWSFQALAKAKEKDKIDL